MSESVFTTCVTQLDTTHDARLIGCTGTEDIISIFFDAVEERPVDDDPMTSFLCGSLGHDDGEDVVIKPAPSFDLDHPMSVQT